MTQAKAISKFKNARLAEFNLGTLNDFRGLPTNYVYKSKQKKSTV